MRHQSYVDDLTMQHTDLSLESLKKLHAEGSKIFLQIKEKVLKFEDKWNIHADSNIVLSKLMKPNFNVHRDFEEGLQVLLSIIDLPILDFGKLEKEAVYAAYASVANKYLPNFVPSVSVSDKAYMDMLDLYNNHILKEQEEKETAPGQLGVDNSELDLSIESLKTLYEKGSELGPQVQEHIREFSKTLETAKNGRHHIFWNFNAAKKYMDEVSVGEMFNAWDFQHSLQSLGNLIDLPKLDFEKLDKELVSETYTNINNTVVRLTKFMERNLPLKEAMDRFQARAR